MQVGVDIARPLMDGWHKFQHGSLTAMLDGVEHAATGLGEVARKWEVDPKPPVNNPEPTTPPPEFSQEAAEKMIRDGKAPPAAWRPFIKQLTFGSASWLADRQLQITYKVGPPNEPINLDLLTGLSRLERLALVSMPLMSIEPLAALESLYWLALESTSLRDIRPISRLVKMNRLNLSRTPVSDLAPLVGLPALEMLYLDYTNVVDLTPLAAIRKQEVIGEAAIGSAIGQPFRIFQLVPSLRGLSLKATRITDFTPCGYLMGLEYLILDDTSITDLSSLSNLIKLEILSLRNIKIADLTPIARLPYLQRLWIDGTTPSAAALNEFIRNRQDNRLPSVDIRHGIKTS